MHINTLTPNIYTSGENKAAKGYTKTSSGKKPYSTPKPDHKPIPKPTHEPIPKSDHEPTPVPDHKPIPKSDHEPTPVPDHKPIPKSDHEPTPVPDHKPIPKPTHETAPESANEPAPDFKGKDSSKIGFKGRFANAKKLKSFSLNCASAAAGTFSASALTNISIPLLNPLSAFLASLSAGSWAASMLVPTGEKLALKAKTEFFNANTIEEARNFAAKNFKINNFAVDNLEIANWINKGLTRLSNKFRGQTYMPEAIALTKFPILSSLPDNCAVAMYNHKYDVIAFNEHAYQNADFLLRLNLEGFPQSLQRMPFGGLGGFFSTRAKLNQYKEAPHTLSAPEKIELHAAVCKLKELYTNMASDTQKLEQHFNRSFQSFARKNLTTEQAAEQNIFGHIYLNPFGTLDHEAGHMFDFKTSSKLNTFIDNKTKPQLFDELTKDLVLSDRSKLDFREYSAELFSGYVNNEAFPEFITNVFDKINRIKLQW